MAEQADRTQAHHRLGAHHRRGPACGLRPAVYLASAEHVSETVRTRRPWRWLPPAFVSQPLRLLDPAGDRLTLPWPDLLIEGGRRSAPVALAVRRASDGRTLAVHIQIRGPPCAFDLVVALSHDPAGGANVLKTLTALHDVTPQRLMQAGAPGDRTGGDRPTDGRRRGGGSAARLLRLADAPLGHGAEPPSPGWRRPGHCPAGAPAAGDLFVNNSPATNASLSGTGGAKIPTSVSPRGPADFVTSDSVRRPPRWRPTPVEIFDLACAATSPSTLRRCSDAGARFEGDPEPPDPAGPTDANATAWPRPSHPRQARMGSSGKAS